MVVPSPGAGAGGDPLGAGGDPLGAGGAVGSGRGRGPLGAGAGGGGGGGRRERAGAGARLRPRFPPSIPIDGAIRGLFTARIAPAPRSSWSKARQRLDGRPTRPAPAPAAVRSGDGTRLRARARLGPRFPRRSRSMARFEAFSRLASRLAPRSSWSESRQRLDGHPPRPAHRPPTTQKLRTLRAGPTRLRSSVTDR
jgi:hypothetical protein